MNVIRPTTTALALALALATAACADDAATRPTTPVTLTLLAYDAFVAPESLAAFTAETGISVSIAKGGDAGTLVNKAILTKGNPEGDVLWGLDNTLLSRALSETGLFLAYESPALVDLEPSATALVPGHEVTPVDTGDVCLNYDKAWFAEHSVAPPTSFADLTDQRYRDLLVVQNPATSSPGLAFLLATVAAYGPPHFIGYWRDLRENGVLVVDDWDTAYYTEFTAGGGGGDRPIVVSYASSPPATIVFAEDPKPTEPTTASVDATCFRQVEFAGILDGTDHENEARALVDFLVSERFQSELPLTNFVYPVRLGVDLPPVFEQFATQVTSPLTVTPDDIDANRSTWIDEWTSAVLR